ncbi:MAG: hypothetical protein HN855_10665 [Anaerolineae bacterium]|nr:hypothetical protein [Anaerolineae bacterium]MBT7071507.1 hypothetical protein [Anaerolineae bacterium]MBT7325614.1 hypothetical protein [Anaerolineae bacterium]
MKRKLIILSTLLLGILACGVTTPTPSPEPAAEPAQVDVAPEVEEVAPEPTATFTPEPEPQEEIIEEKPSCIELLTPPRQSRPPRRRESSLFMDSPR